MPLAYVAGLHRAHGALQDAKRGAGSECYGSVNRLLTDALAEAPRRPGKALQRSGLPLDALRALRHGETIEIPPDIRQSRRGQP